VAFRKRVTQIEIIDVEGIRPTYPMGRRWDAFFKSGPRVDDDFIVERDQPPVTEREPL
jgi:virulence-associated protein VagC